MSEVKIERAGLPAWAELARFHYRSHRVGVVRQVWAAVWRPCGMRGAAGAAGVASRTAGVVVVTMPVLNCARRDVATAGRYAIPDKRRRARRINREVRCIARVVVHPRFRGMGLAVRLVRHAIAHAGVPYVEAFAAMGRVNPMFGRAGMRRFGEPPDPAARRLIAALASIGVHPREICDDRLWRPKLRRAGAQARQRLREEMRRYAAAAKVPRARLARGSDAALIAAVRTRILSRPVYYLWRREAAPRGRCGCSRAGQACDAG